MGKGHDRRVTLRRLLTVVVMSVPVTAGSLAATAQAAHADWAGDNCFVGSGTASSPVARTVARDELYYAYSNGLEGYHWAGGCFKNNDIDDTPNYTPETASPRGEGTDCSGLVWRAWRLSNTTSTSFRVYAINEFHHGTASATSYRNSTDAWVRLWSPSYPLTWDVYVNLTSNHVGLFYTPSTAGVNDWIVESKAENAGTDLFLRNYRYNSSYGASRRNGWTA